MSVSPKELLSQAEAALQAAATEPDIRSAASRGYYSAYHSAKAFYEGLASPGQMPPRPSGIHKELHHRLLYPTIPPDDPDFGRSRQIARDLMWMHTKRIKADYELDSDFDRAEAIEVLDRAKRILTLIKG